MKETKKKIIESYQVVGGFIVHDCEMLSKIFKAYGIDPKTSTHRKIFDLESLGHFFQTGSTKLFNKLGITKNDYVLSLGEGSGATSRLLAKLIGCKVTGIDINPEARIDESFTIDHGTGVVIGATAIIGKNVKLYQGVTLGAKSFPLDENGNPIKGVPRHPIVEDDVVIYSNATVLGRITIGKGAIIGGNVWVTNNVAPKAKVLQFKPRDNYFLDGGGI